MQLDLRREIELEIDPHSILIGKLHQLHVQIEHSISSHFLVIVV